MRTTRIVAALLTTITFVAAGCGSDSGGDEATALDKIGPAEDTLNLVVWAGYAEDGSTSPDYDWVTKFETDTKCNVQSKTAATSDEMFALMQTGEYDGV